MITIYGALRVLVLCDKDLTDPGRYEYNADWVKDKFKLSLSLAIRLPEFKRNPA
jgi:hypothetical protein